MSSQSFYQQPVLLSRNKHKNLRLTAPGHLEFTRHLNSVPINGAEFFVAARDLPILFGTDGKEQFFPLALLSLSNSGHQLLDEKGAWKSAVYLPGFIRRYPFTLSSRGGVLVDAKAPHFAGKNTGKPLLTASGEFTPLLKSAITFLARYEKDTAATREFAAACKAAGLLKPCNLKVRQGQGQPLSLSSLYMLDAAGLKKLPAETVVEWHRKGWLAWAYAHLNSLSALQRLARRKSEA